MLLHPWPRYSIAVPSMATRVRQTSTWLKEQFYTGALWLWKHFILNERFQPLKKNLFKAVVALHIIQVKRKSEKRLDLIQTELICANTFSA